MRILFVAPNLPIPTSGGRTRLHNLIKQLAARHDISVLSFIHPDECDQRNQIEPFCTTIQTVLFARFVPTGKWRNRIQGWRQIIFDTRPTYATTFPIESMRYPLRELLVKEDFDLVVLNHLFVVELASELGDLPVILMEENVESAIEYRKMTMAAHPAHKLRDWLRWRKLRHFEEHWLRRIPVCVAVSAEDAAIITTMSPATEVFVVPNGVDSAAFAPGSQRRKPDSLLFFGTLSYEPNVDGLVWFCDNIWPKVRAAKPDARLEIVGAAVPPSIRSLAALPGIDVVGFVLDIREKLWSATASIVPLQVGGGTRLKVLESLAAGCPVISTSVGAQGLDLVPNTHLLIADSVDEFAHQVIALLDDPQMQSQLAANGMQITAQHYDWQQIADTMDAACLRAKDLI